MKRNHLEMSSENIDSNALNTNLNQPELVERIVGTLIHEINGPLGTALAAVQIAKRLSPPSAAEIRQWLDQSAASIREAARLTRRMKKLCHRSEDLQAASELLTPFLLSENSGHA